MERKKWRENSTEKGKGVKNSCIEIREAKIGKNSAKKRKGGRKRSKR